MTEEYPPNAEGLLRAIAKAIVEHWKIHEYDVNPDYDRRGSDDEEVNPYLLPVPMEKRFESSLMAVGDASDGGRVIYAPRVIDVARVAVRAAEEYVQESGVRESLKKLDGTDLKRVAFVTGLSVEELERLGGIPEEQW